MKKMLVAILVLVTTLLSCKKEIPEEEVTVIVNESVIVDPVVTECYRAVLKKDTIDLSINTLKDSVQSGNLSYNFFEKDDNSGELIGVIKGDTIFATYNFMSEGTKSSREVVFLKNGKLLTEGYGDVIDDNSGKVVFKDKKKLFFDSRTILTKIECTK